MRLTGRIIKWQADQANFSGEKLKLKSVKHINKFSIYLSVLFITLLSAAYFIGKLPQTILFSYFGMSIISFFAYAFDKSKAQRGVWRTQESTLHLLALVGGWPGAALAQQLLRHKSSKRQFRATFWFTVIINSAALAWLMTPQGESLLMQFR